MIREKTWEEFMNAGMLWLVNTILQVFGWSICVDTECGEVLRVYPARVKFRGFPEEVNTSGYIELAQYMKANAEEICKEAEE